MEGASQALGVALMLVLLAHVASHVAIVFSIARGPAYGRAAFAFVFPPAGVFWAWEAGRKKNVAAYGVTLATFAVLLVVASFAR
jgi:hypothetical protein